MTTDEILLERFSRLLGNLKRLRAVTGHQRLWLAADCLHLDLVKMNKQRRVKVMRQMRGKEAA